MTISERSTEKLRKFVFFTMFEKGLILRKIWICLNNCFWSNKYKGMNINKNFFLHKLSHILLNYGFLMFWSNLLEIHRELFFLDIKVTISETSTEKLRKFVFLPSLKGANPEENLDMFKLLFFIKPVKGININKTVFLQRVSHKLLNYGFLFFWSNLGEIHS